MSTLDNLLEQCLRRNLQGFETLVSVERLTGGASLETYRLNVVCDQNNVSLVLRRAPSGKPIQRGPVAPGLAVEAKLMQCAKKVGVPEPAVIYLLTPEDGLGEGFIMEWVEGVSVGQQVLKAPELDQIRPQLAYQCGAALAKIHTIDLDATGLRSDLRELGVEDLVRGTWDKYISFDVYHPMLDYTGRWLMENIPEGSTNRLVHNDYRNGNIMFTSQGISAVLDWEFAYIGDPMRDLGWMCMNSWRYGATDKQAGGLGSYEEFFAGYESVSESPVDIKKVQFWELYGSFLWATGCLEMGHKYRNGMDKSVDRPGIGRRLSECLVDCANLLIPGPIELVEPLPTSDNNNMPNLDELLKSVVDFLRDDVLENTRGRTNFLARVANNSLGIVRRECEFGEAARLSELARLQALFDSQDDLTTLRKRLCHGLRDNSMPLDASGLADHLRYTVVNQLAIDQPKYSGLSNALAFNNLT